MGRRRQVRRQRLKIYAFCEGESEKQYLKRLGMDFSDRISITPKVELFENAVRRFEKDAEYKKNIPELDEIWFFFDAGDIDGMAKEWNTIQPHIKTLRTLRRMRQKPQIRVRLLMTTGCLEYWLMLHFQKYRPAVLTKEQRDQVVRDLDKTCQNTFSRPYEKGNADIIDKIFTTGLGNAIQYGAYYLQELEKSGLPPLTYPLEPDSGELDKRYEWLLSQTDTFTTVQEAIVFLRSLSPFIT